MADYFTVRDGKKVVYRPTVHYAYHPCDAAIMSMHEIAGKNLKQLQDRGALFPEDLDKSDPWQFKNFRVV